MTGLPTPNAAFIGSGALLVACADIWIARGNHIRGVVTSCPTAAAWCERAGIPHIRPKEDQAAWLGGEPFDYLFSIVNHAITPDAVLRLPAKRAINYHDAPLPKYAGFNATSWAILNGETTHAVTWHAMTADVDGGDILLQQTIDILDDDVAFSLGAKCIAAGRESFERLVRMLDAEAAGAVLDTRKQGAREQFHLRSERPGLGVVDFKRTVQQIRNHVRALNLGSDDNWMCRPKLALPCELFVVEQADRVSGPSVAPGTVVAVDATGIEIAVADGVLRFSSLATLDGEAVSSLNVGVRAGEVLRAFSDTGDSSDAALTKHERFWVDRLSTMRGPVVAGLKPRDGAIDSSLLIRQLPATIGLLTAERRTALIAALLAYIARTGEDEGFDLALGKSLPVGLQAAYAAATPFRVTVNKTAGFDQLREQVVAELATQDKRGSYARDVVTRYDALRSRKEKPRLAIGVQFSALDGSGSLAGDMRLALVIPNEGDSFGWVYDPRSIDDASLGALADRFDVLLASGLRDGGAPRRQSRYPSRVRAHAAAGHLAGHSNRKRDRCVHPRTVRSPGGENA